MHNFYHPCVNIVLDGSIKLNNTGSHNISIKTETKRWITISNAIFFCDELRTRFNSDLIVLHWSIVRLYTMGSLVYRPKLDPSAVRLYSGTVVL